MNPICCVNPPLHQTRPVRRQSQLQIQVCLQVSHHPRQLLVVIHIWGTSPSCQECNGRPHVRPSSLTQIQQLHHHSVKYNTFLLVKQHWIVVYLEKVAPSRGLGLSFHVLRHVSNDRLDVINHVHRQFTWRREVKDHTQVVMHLSTRLIHRCFLSKFCIQHGDDLVHHLAVHMRYL